MFVMVVIIVSPYNKNRNKSVQYRGDKYVQTVELKTSLNFLNANYD